MKKTLLFFFYLSVLYTQAQWVGDSTLNNAIATGNLVNSRNGLVSIPSGDGGMFLAWEDTTNTSSIGTDIYLQKINADGTVAFATNGLAITTQGGTKSNITMISDGAGGVVLAWQDNRNNDKADIYGQRVTSTGNFLWATEGRILADTVGLQQAPSFCAGSSGEVILLYRTSMIDYGSTSSYDLYVAKVNISTGNFTAPKMIANGANIQTAQQIAADGSGGAFIVWQDPYKGNSEADIHIQRINSNLDTLWSGTGCNGIAICNATANQLAPTMAVDPSGVTVAWGDVRGSSTNQEIYAQRVNYSGAPQWTSNGVIVCNAAGNQTNVRAVRSDNGVILVWGDNRVSTSNRDIYAQKVSDTDGSAMWSTVNGVAICTATGNQPNSVTSGFVVFSDNSNGAYITWDDARNGSSSLDVRSQLIDNLGNSQWAPNGAAVAIGTGNQNQQVAVATPTGLMLAWRDARTATGAEIYASLQNRSNGVLVSSSPLPVQFVRVQASLQNGVGLVQWQIANEINVARYEIEKSSNGTQFERIGTVTAKQASSYQFTDRKLLLGKNYYRIKAVDNDGKTTYSSIALLEQQMVATLTVNALPNPVTSELKVQAANLATGDYSLRIIQSNGSVVRVQRFSSSSTLTSVTVPMAQLVTGTYTLVITNAKGENLYHTQIQKQ